MAEKVFPIVRPAHFFFLTVRSGNAWRSNPTFYCKQKIGKYAYFLFWRRGWDSNPRSFARKLISSQPRYDHFDTSPYSFVSADFSKKITQHLAAFVLH